MQLHIFKRNVDIIKNLVTSTSTKFIEKYNLPKKITLYTHTHIELKLLPE